MSSQVIAVDLDGTLANTDTLHEQIALLLFSNVKKIPGAITALFKGKAAFKSYNAKEILLKVESLNYQTDLIEFLQHSKEQGAYIVLCTAADSRVADAVSKYHQGLFDEVIGTKDNVNLKGKTKAALLKERFPEGFIYAGDSSADLAVWEESDEIILVGASKNVTKKAKALGKSLNKPIAGEYEHKIKHAKSRFRIWTKALRVKHWAKNVLMFIPLILSHSFLDVNIISQTFLGFLLLLAITSSTYLINDLADLDADRKHPTKRFRPIASGAVAISDALIIALITIPIALVLAFLLKPAFAFALFGYLVITLSYSFGLKKIPMLDTFIIGTLFTSRIVMGGLLLGVALSDWLLVFSMFFFFSLAVAKRQVEILQMKSSIEKASSGRGYIYSDAELLLVFGVSSSVASLLILVLYMKFEAFEIVGYARPDFLWGIVMAVAIWLGRIWLLTHRGQMNDDPVDFALQDKTSIALGAVVALSFLVAM